jgi:RecJ-like exonuclease
MQTQTVCPECEGTGEVVAEKCPDCRGQGAVQANKQIKIDVPAGVQVGGGVEACGCLVPLSSQKVHAYTHTPTHTHRTARSCASRVRAMRDSGGGRPGTCTCS